MINKNQSSKSLEIMDTMLLSTSTIQKMDISTLFLELFLKMMPFYFSKIISIYRKLIILNYLLENNNNNKMKIKAKILICKNLFLYANMDF